MQFTTVMFLKLLLTATAFFLVAVCAFLFIGWPKVDPTTEYGATFSHQYAEELGLDADAALITALDDVGVRRFRIPAYWGLLEKGRGEWDFSVLDKDISEIGKRGGKVILAIGEKLPRWPECWGPQWWKKLPRAEQRPLTLKYLETVVKRYQENPTILAWQVENEPHFRYGDCPTPDYLFIEQETELARRLDPTREILTTDSGELSAWLTLGSHVDKLGISVYRLVRNQWFGTLNIRYWFVPPYFYTRKAALLKPFGVKDLYVSEFQMEPWSNKPLLETPVKDQLTSMNLKQMQANFWFAERMGVDAVDFWGIEWWIWMKEKQNRPELLDTAKAFYQSHTKK